MKIWWMRYTIHDTHEVIAHPHISKESAERDGLYQIITKGLPASPSEFEQDLAEDVLTFFGLIVLGGYSQALLSYRAICKDQDWEDLVEVVEENVLEETDVPLIQALTSTKSKWDSAMDEFDLRRDAEEDAEEDADEGDDGDQVA